MLFNQEIMFKVYSAIVQVFSANANSFTGKIKEFYL